MRCKAGEHRKAVSRDNTLPSARKDRSPSRGDERLTRHALIALSFATRLDVLKKAIMCDRATPKRDDSRATAAAKTTSDACIAFLQWALPHLGLRWPGFRKVRGQVCKRLRRRLEALGLPDLAAYRQRLEQDAKEWQVLDGLCRITISRFYRNRGVFDLLRVEVLPALCQDLARAGQQSLRCLSLGCCGGEEPFTLGLIWHFDLAPRFPGMSPEILATESDPKSLARAALGCYSAGSLKDLPAGWREAAFDLEDEDYCLRSEFRRAVRFLEQDLRDGMPAGLFHLVLCRNIVFTYFDEDRQRQSAANLAEQMPSGGILVLGKHEHLPSDLPGFETVSAHLAIYRRT